MATPWFRVRAGVRAGVRARGRVEVALMGGHIPTDLRGLLAIPMSRDMAEMRGQGAE